MALNKDRIKTLMRRVIARRNETDITSTDAEIESYIDDFIKHILPQLMKNFENWSTYSFSTVSGTETYAFPSTFANLGPSAFSGNQTMYWYEDAKEFYDKWGYPEDPTDLSDVETGQPSDILLWNNQFYLRPIPDDGYNISIFGFKQNTGIDDASIPEYMNRIVAYGASVDYMSDFGYDIARIDMVEKMFQKYKALVQSRTYNQVKNQRAIPRF